MVFLILLFNCQKEDEIKNSQQKVQNSIQKSFDYEVKTFDELTTSKKFNKVYNKVTDKIKENKSSSSSKTAMEDMYNFTIDSTSIVEVELENYTSYTFSIYRDEPSVDYYENLFIEIDSTDSPQASLLKYNINTYDNSVTSIVATKIIYDSSSTSGKIIYNDDVECTTISIYYITTCPCEGHWPGESCTCTQGQPTSILLNSYSSCDFNSGGGTPEESEIGTITFTPSNQNIGSSGGQYSTYSYTVSNSNNILSQRRKSLKTAFGMNTWNWFNLQDEEFKGDIFSYLESTINIDGLVSNATSYPQEAIDHAIEIINSGIEGSLISAMPFVKYPNDLAEEYTENYPNFTDYLKNELENLKSDQDIIAALDQIGIATQVQIEEALTWGSGPTVRITPLSADNTMLGKYNPTPLGEDGADYGSNVIEINSYFVDLLEETINSENPQYDIKAFKFFIAIVILHEYTHYADFNYTGYAFQQSGIETGSLFETNLFYDLIVDGQQFDININNFNEVIQQYFLIRN